MDAVLYARVSSDPLGDLSSVTRQLVDLRALAELRGDTVTAEFVDDNEPAYRRRTPRPQFTAMRAHIEAGGCRALYAWHPDRLYRSLRDLEDLVDLVEQHDLMVCTARAGIIDLSNATGRLVARLVGATARYESEHKGERLARKFAAGAADGTPAPNGGLGFGYHPGFQSHHPTEAQAIRVAAEVVLAGNTFADATAAARDVLGYPVPATTLRAALTAHRTAGLLKYVPETDKRRGVTTGTVTKGDWELILDEPTWLQVREVLIRPSRPQGGHGRISCLLSKLLLCGVCGNPMIGHGRRYECPPSWSGCAKVSINKAGAEAFATGWVRHPSHRRRIRARIAQIDGDAEQSANYRDIEQRRLELAALFGAGTISVAEWHTARDQLARRVHSPAQLDVTLLRERDMLRRALTVLAAWDTATVLEQRTTILAVLGDRRIVIAASSLTVVGRVDQARFTVRVPDVPPASHTAEHPAQVGMPAARSFTTTGPAPQGAVTGAASAGAESAEAGLDVDRERVLFVVSRIEAHRQAAHDAISRHDAAEHTREANRLLLHLSTTGTTAAELARLLGVTRQAVHQRLVAAQTPPVTAAVAHHVRPAKNTETVRAAKARKAEMMTPGEAAHELGLTYDGLQGIARRGEVDYLKTPGGHPRYFRASVHAWKTAHPMPPPVDGLPVRR